MKTELQFLDEWIPEQMEPGTLFLLEHITEAQESGGNPFCAVLSCPSCGCLGLITRYQYMGMQPMICGSQYCSAEYVLCEEGIRYRKPH